MMDYSSIQKLTTDMTPKQLGTLGFNLMAFSWVGMNLAIGPNQLPLFLPCSYLHPNLLNMASSVTLLVGAAVCIVSIKKGNIIGPVIALTFLWSVVASLLRQFGLLNGAFIS